MRSGRSDNSANFVKRVGYCLRSEPIDGPGHNSGLTPTDFRAPALHPGYVGESGKEMICQLLNIGRNLVAAQGVEEIERRPEPDYSRRVHDAGLVPERKLLRSVRVFIVQISGLPADQKRIEFG